MEAERDVIMRREAAIDWFTADTVARVAIALVRPIIVGCDFFRDVDRAILLFQ